MIAVLVVAFVVAALAESGVFSFNPLIETMAIALVVLLVVYYFFQKRNLRKE